MLIFICVSILFLVFLSLPFRIKVKVLFDIEDQKGAILAKLFGIKVFRIEAEIKEGDNGLLVINRLNKKRYKVKANKKGSKDVADKLKLLPVIGNLNVRRVSLVMRYGGGDAVKTVYVLGVIRVIFYALASALDCRDTVEVHEDITADFENKSFNIRLYGIICLSIADIIYGILRLKVLGFKKFLKRKKRRKALEKQIFGKRFMRKKTRRIST